MRTWSGRGKGRIGKGGEGDKSGVGSDVDIADGFHDVDGADVVCVRGGGGARCAVSSRVGDGCQRTFSSSMSASTCSASLYFPEDIVGW